MKLMCPTSLGTSLCGQARRDADGPGPGFYNISESQSSKTGAYAPFLSLCSRPCVFRTSDVAFFSPGPGQYDTARRERVLGGNSLQNRTKRFHNLLPDVPGPGSYHPHTPAQKFCTSLKRWCGSVRLMLRSDVPSIPSPGQSFCFEEDGDGVLQRYRPPSPDQTLGPAFYSPAREERKCAYPRFDGMTGRAVEATGTDSPGPGHYDPHRGHSVHYHNLNVRAEHRSRTELLLPRYHELLPLLELKRAVPGPGHYHVSSQFDVISKTLGGARVRQIPFPARTRRFGATRSGDPCDPGAEEPPKGRHTRPSGCVLFHVKKASLCSSR